MAAEGQLSPAEPEPKEANAPIKEAKTHINIGAQHGRWMELKEDLQCENDTLAKLLLDIWYEFKDEESAARSGRSENKHSDYRKHPASMVGQGQSSVTPQSANSSLQDSQDTLDSSNCSTYGDMNGSLAENVDDEKGDKGKGEYHKGNNRKSSRRKQPKSQVSRYLEDDDEELTEQERKEIAETALEDYEAGRLKWEQDETEEESGAMESRDSFDDADDADENEANASMKQEEEEEEEEEEEQDDENDFLSEEELEKLLKGSESESETKKSKRKRDSDSDWMPTADDDKPKRRRSRRISRQSARIGAGRGRRSSKRRVSTSGDDSSEVEVEEEVAVVEEKPAKNPRGRPRKTRKDPVEEEETKPSQRSQKPKLMKKSGIFSCAVCNESFSTKEEGKEHLETHYTIDCNMCTQRFYSLQTLAHHQSKKHPANHKCNHCFFTGRTRMELKRHMRKDHQEEQTVPGTTLCHICGQQFRFVINVQKHLMDVHGIMESNMKTYMCDQCGNEYFLKHSLRKHMLTHKDKNILCDFEGCGSRFSSDAQYKRHYNTVHLKIKRHACPYDDCDMKFAFRKTLATHVNMVHLKLRLFPCTWQGCERSFYAKKHLTVHLRIHNDEKPFKCPECDYRCRQRAALNWHLKKHGIVPDHPESLENERRNKKDGFPVNFKRGRKRTRFRKAKSLDYTDEQIASINQRYNEMVSGGDQPAYPGKDLSSLDADGSSAHAKEGSTTGSDQASYDGRDPIERRDGISNEDFKYLERREQVQRPSDLAQGYARRELQSPAQESFATELLKREVEYPRMDYEASKQTVRVEDFHTIRDTEFQHSRDPDYNSIRDEEYQPSRENSLPSVREGVFQSVRDGGFGSSRETSFPQIREGDYHTVRDTSEYHGFSMKENLDTDRGFPRFISKDVFSSSSHREGHFTPRLPMKDSYVTGHPVSEVDYSRFAPKNELAALRTLPPGFQSQMDVPTEYDPRSPVHAVMGGNSASYSQDLQMYSREYK